MGTKRAFDEDLQEFIKHPKHLDYGNKCPSVTENKLPHETCQIVGITGENDITAPDTVIKEFEITTPLPLVTGVDTGEDDSGPKLVFSADLFSEFSDYNFPRRQLFHYDDIYSSLLNISPRKMIPIGPDHQVDVPEFDPETAKNYNDGTNRFLGICAVPFHHSNIDPDNKTRCECIDGGSIRCVQEHVKESRSKLKKSYGHEKFIDLGMLEMGDEIACKWNEEEERLFHEIVYLNPISLGRMFWKHLSIAFPSRTMKELVSYYFNVFILHRRAIQNRSSFLDIDSDDDEWRESYGGHFGDKVENDDFVVGDRDSFSEDGGVHGGYDGNDGNDGSPVIMNENKVIIEDDQENGLQND